MTETTQSLPFRACRKPIRRRITPPPLVPSLPAKPFPELDIYLTDAPLPIDLTDIMLDIES